MPGSRVRIATFLALAALAPMPFISPTPNTSATPATARFESPSPTPVAPPSPTVWGSADDAKIGDLERAGAGPIRIAPGVTPHPRRTTPASAFARYLNSPDSAISARAAIAVGRLRNTSGVGELVSLLQSSTASDDAKAAAAFSLGIIGSTAAQPALANALLHDSPSIAGAAADALGRIGGDNVIDPLIRGLSSRDPFVRGKAAIGIGEATALVAPTRQLDQQYRIAAAQAISNAVRFERDPESKWRMAWAIGRSLYNEDQPDLRTLLSDKSELVREFAAQGMRRLKDSKFALALHLAANDPSWRVRVEVERALVALKDNTHVDLTPPAVPADDSTQPAAVAPTDPYGAHPEVAIVTTKGVIVLELFPDEAPYNVDNFLFLVDRGFYDDQQLFRVIQNFVIQGGDPTNGGSDGGPGYTVPAEANPLEQLTGVLALGLDYPDNVHAAVDSGGSQFYITQSPQLHLDVNFSTFGRVVKGMAVVDAIRVHDAESQADRAKPADLVLKMYRCQPVIAQTADIEHLLRTKEIGYDGH
jgi:peptidyl-prolyl cis-trans isomerase B (cyclophilin B)